MVHHNGFGDLRLIGLSNTDQRNMGVSQKEADDEGIQRRSGIQLGGTILMFLAHILRLHCRLLLSSHLESLVLA
jgi:hypothetical protein